MSTFSAVYSSLSSQDEKEDVRVVVEYVTGPDGRGDNGEGKKMRHRFNPEQEFLVYDEHHLPKLLMEV